MNTKANKTKSLIAAIIIVLVALFLILDVSIQTHSSTGFGREMWGPPASNFNGDLVDNTINFRYKTKNEKPIDLLVDGKVIKSMLVQGEGIWRIELDNNTLAVSGSDPIIELPVSDEGALKFKGGIVDESGMTGFDILIGDIKILTLGFPSDQVRQ